MIVGSLLLLVAGAGFLIAGLASGNDTFLIGTIVASLMAAVCLYAGSRNRSAGKTAPQDNRDDAGDSDAEFASVDSRLRGRPADRRGRADSDFGFDEPEERPAEAAQERSAGRKSSRQDYLDIDVETNAVPDDEPAEVPMSSVEAAALMRMDAEVMVVDGRPRFHLGGCVHLIGRDPEALPAYEAVELGFTACSLCRPAQSLLREPTRQ